MRSVENYFRALHYSYMAGAARTAYYPALAQLLDELGRSLKPKVRCLLNLKDISPTLPDGGFFTPDQFPKAAGATAGLNLPTTPPNRGAIDIVESSHDLYTAAYSQPIEKHLKKYRYLLMTNFWGFLLLGLDADDQPIELESYSLAEGEADFWGQIAQPRYLATIHGHGLAEFLTRAMLYPLPLVTPQNVARFLASYARQLNSRLEHVTLLASETVHATTLLQALDRIRLSFESGPGLSFKGNTGNRLFYATLVQTLFCAIFSAWVLWHYEQPAQEEQFDWRLSHWHLRLPLLHALFRQLASPGHLGEQGLEVQEILDWVGDTLKRVDRAEFFDQFEAGQVIQSFYEPFLAAFSPHLRKTLGVWQTPPEVVTYMVARVDQLLRQELGLVDGLASEQVYLLDPCCGTGSYLVETLNRIAATLQQKGDESLIGYYVKKAALKRVLGFEIMPAAFVMAHLQLGLLLHRLDMPFATTERPAVHLANALSQSRNRGSDPFIAEDSVPLPELQAEQDAVGAIQQSQKILVILGHPPHGLADLYLQFFDLAGQKVIEHNQGIICYLTDYTWLDAPDLAGRRGRYLELFDQIWIDSLNGDKHRTANLTPTGEPDPNLFSTRSNRQGTGIGAAITLLLRQNPHRAADKIRFRHLWGKNKPAQLLETTPSAGLYQELRPDDQAGCSFMPPQSLSDYLMWPLLPELFPVSFPALAAQDKAATGSDTTNNQLVKYVYRPFDSIFIQRTAAGSFNEKQKELAALVEANNLFLVCARKLERGQEGIPFYMTRLLADKYLIRSGGLSFPLTLKGQTSTLFDQLPHRSPANLSAEGHKYLFNLGIPDPEAGEETASLIGHHVLAIGYTPAYLLENEGGLRQDWPRLPLPNNQAALRKSASLGQKITALLTLETPVLGVSTGAIRSELKTMAVIKRADDDDLNPETDLMMTTTWADRPGFGNLADLQSAEDQPVERRYMPPEQAAIERGAAALGLTLDQLDHYFGSTTCDIYLNKFVYWANIPFKVWEYTIGGYPILRSWLSYRQQQKPGRPLRPAETREFTAIVRRIAALVLMEPALDANYHAIKKVTYPWPVAR